MDITTDEYEKLQREYLNDKLKEFVQWYMNPNTIRHVGDYQRRQCFKDFDEWHSEQLEQLDREIELLRENNE